MKKTLAYRSVRFGYRLLKNAYFNLKEFRKKKKEKMLFVFGGRSEGWPGLGRELYNKDPDFKASIQYCNNILVQNGGSEILSYFENPLNEHYFDDESKFTCITVIQITTVELYHNSSIYANAVFGISLGEIAAAFTAGALTIDEALIMSVAFCRVHEGMELDYLFLLLKLNFLEAVQILKNCPVNVNLVFEDSKDKLIVVCKKSDLSQAKLYLNSKNIVFRLVTDKTNAPYHTYLIRSQSVFLERINKYIKPKPLKCDFYSPSLGIRIAKGTILANDYWFELICKPVLFDTTVNIALTEGYNMILQIGPPAISDRHFKVFNSERNLTILNSFSLESYNENEVLALNVQKIGKTNLEPSPIAKNNSEEDILKFVLDNFDIHSTSHYLELDYLKDHGDVHFLSRHNAWIILGYDNTDFILKDSESFSSSIYSAVDHVLMGGSPETHKVVRSVLQPLFSTHAITKIGQSAFKISEKLLLEVLELDEFDLVKDFSDVLSQKIIFGFMGFTQPEAEELSDVIGRDYHDSNFFERLLDHFQNNFDLTGHKDDDNFLGLVQKTIQCGEFTKYDAASILRIILTAGIATTSTLISSILKSLHSNPELVEIIRNDEKLTNKYIEECLRLETPAHYVRRITTKPIVISGRQLPENAVIYINLRSANRDLKHFDNPNQFNLYRPAKRNLVFGSGIHQCIGMGIARSAARSTIQMVLNNFDNLQKYSWSVPEYFKDSEVQAMTTLKLKREN